MLDAPRQDWNAYRELTTLDDRHAARSLTFAERFIRYADLFQLVCGQVRAEAQQSRMDQRRWEHKLDLRRKQNRAFGLSD